MQVIGFNFTKISANREKKINNLAISNNIQFLEFEKDKVEIIKDKEAIRVDFLFSIDYDDKIEKEKAKDKSKYIPQAQVLFEGNILLLVSEDESKEILKGWKKKEITPNLRIFLLNFLLTKCTTKALSIEEDLNLPYHISLPKLKLN